jgi:hypothetical protein
VHKPACDGTGNTHIKSAGRLHDGSEAEVNVMRTPMIVLLLSGALATSGMALAQQPGTTPMPETSQPAATQPMPSEMQPGQSMPKKKQAMRPARRSCFAVAMQFDRALQQKMMQQGTTTSVGLDSATRMYGEATQLRNMGMEKCHAGDVTAGRAQVEEAIRALQM